MTTDGGVKEKNEGKERLLLLLSPQTVDITQQKCQILPQAQDKQKSLQSVLPWSVPKTWGKTKLPFS